MPCSYSRLGERPKLIRYGEREGWGWGGASRDIKPSKLVDVTACFHCRRGFQCITPPVVLAIDCSFRETVTTSLRYVGAGRDLSTEVRRYVRWEGSLRYVGTLALAGKVRGYVGWEGSLVCWLAGI